MCYFGENVGFKRHGGENFLRPILILKAISPNCAICLPLTMQIPKKHLLKNRFEITKFFAGKKSFVILDEICTLDKRRFLKKINELPESIFWQIKNKCIENLKK